MKSISVFAAICLLTGVAEAATCNASATRTSINSCISSSAIGDTIQIAAGTVTSGTVMSITKGLIIQGAGIGSTTINGNGFSINLTADNRVEISGITFTGTGGTSEAIYSDGTPTHPSEIVIHDVEMSGYFNAVNIDQGFGVMYDSTITGNEHAFRFGGYSSVPSGIPALPWARNSNYFFVVEDCVMGPTSPEQIMVVTNGVFPYYFRHNMITENSSFPEIFDLHGINPGELNNIGVVITENTFSLVPDGRAVNLRGGTENLVYNNHVANSNNADIEMDANCGGNCDPVTDTHIWGNDALMGVAAFGNTLNVNYFLSAPAGYDVGTSDELAYPHPFRDATPPASTPRFSPSLNLRLAEAEQ